MILLLQGKPRVGKSTIIKNVVNLLGPDICGGFYTEEIREANERIGFRCVSLDGKMVDLALKIIAQNTHVVLGTVPVDSHPVIDKVRTQLGATIITVDQENRDSISDRLTEMILKEI